MWSVSERLPPPHIACFIDRSEASDAALAEAVHLRGRAPGRLSVVHVAPTRAVLAGGLSDWEIDDDDPLGPPRRWVEERAAAVDGAEPVLLSGDPAGPVANAWVAEAGVGLAVASAHGRRVRRAVLGSFARDLAYGAPCDVLIARPGAPESGEARRLGCCVDDSEGSGRALALARDAAALGPSRVSLVHVIAPPSGLPRRLIARLLPAPGGRRRDAEDLLRRHAADVEDAAQVVLTGAPGPAVCAWAEREGVGMLVIGPRAGGRPGLGGFAAGVVAQAPCAVLLARPGG